MAKKKENQKSQNDEVLDIRHTSSSRINIPPAGLLGRGNIVKEGKIKYEYNPHLPPILRFDETGEEDRILELINAAKERKLTDEEIEYLTLAYNNHQPWLEWSGKKEQLKCLVDPVALNIHERVSAQAIITAAKREDIQRDIFADPELDYNKAIQFYKHPMGWANRLILGDSLAVMASLSRREGLAGQVQMIYMDPPYGIKFSSNFMPDVFTREVREKDQDLTREIETVKAYRDTWRLGIHSYLSYLRDRILVCHELLSKTGSIFVQINAKNVHYVRQILDDIFGESNFICVIAFRTAMTKPTNLINDVFDFICWYSKDINSLRYNSLFVERKTKDISTQQLESSAIQSIYQFNYNGRNYNPVKGWRVSKEGIIRLSQSNRIDASGTLRYIRMYTDFPYKQLDNVWNEQLSEQNKKFVVQTNKNVIERCMLLCSDPGDLVLDPTCGSGTTAYVAEQWGRRWITIDISRISMALARQRLLTSTYAYYKLRPTNAQEIASNPDGPWINDPQGNIDGSCTFDCKTASHITLKSIAQNQALDPIFEKWDPIIRRNVDRINKSLQTLKEETKKQFKDKYKHMNHDNKKGVKEDDYRIYVLPPDLKRDYTTVDNNFNGWYEWEIPHEPAQEYSEDLKRSIAEYWESYEARMKEIDECIEARADHEDLIDHPYVDSNVTRVSGPFTVEGVIPIERSIGNEDDETPQPNLAEAGEETDVESESQNSEAFLDYVIGWLKDNGIQVNQDTQYKFSHLEKQSDGTILHATGIWEINDTERKVAVTIGPQYGSINALIVEEAIRMAARRGYDDLIFAAFSFEGSAQAIIQEDQDPQLRVHQVNISPDVSMGDLLKNSQVKSLFTISGKARINLIKQDGGEYIVQMEGVDLYDPITNTVSPTKSQKVASWFLDSDYDGKCFCICQAFYPNKDAWKHIKRNMKGILDEDDLAKYSGIESLPFKAGKHKKIAVKVVDPRGNEVMNILRLV